MRSYKSKNLEQRFAVSDWDFDLVTRLGNHDFVAEFVKSERENLKENSTK